MLQSNKKKSDFRAAVSISSINKQLVSTPFKRILDMGCVGVTEGLVLLLLSITCVWGDVSH